MSVPLWRSAGLDVETVREVEETYGLPNRIARVLCTRVAQTDISMWLNPMTIPYQSPDVFLHMDVAIARIRDAITRGERIAVIGDYDVDGVTATAILGTTLEAIGADYHCLIPHRVDDGYGLSTDLVDRAAQAGCSLIVTVDNGIRAIEAVTYATTHGIDVIVTDHHEPGEELPDAAIAIIHFIHSRDKDVAVLSGAGVAWKVACALLEGTPHSELLRWHLGLATLGALADIMPMKGENRRLVKEGLAVLNASSQPGWRALCDIAGVKIGNLSETTLLWSITPRINAAGRMGTAEVALALLMAKDETEAVGLAAAVEDKNNERRRETTRSTDEAIAMLDAVHSAAAGIPPVIVVVGPWPLGVVGIVAAKLADAYGRAAIVFADDGGDLLRGSGRSPDGIPFYGAVSRCQDLLAHFGGHSTALGCGITRENLDAFRSAVSVALNDEMASTATEPDAVGSEASVIADDYLPLSEATLQTAQWLERLGPYGPGYPPYRFYVGPVVVGGVVPMGAGKHLRLTVREGRTATKLIWFNPPSWAFDLQNGSLLSAVVLLEVNTWQGRQQAQLRVETAWLLRKPVMRDDFAAVYRLLQTRRRLMASELEQSLQANSEASMQTIFDTFVDLGFAYFNESAYHVVEQAQTRDLRDSIVYQAHLRQAALL